MFRFHRALCGASCVLALLCALAGCGSSNSSTPVFRPVGGDPEPEAIHGVATPSSVAVVTATNAN